MLAMNILGTAATVFTTKADLRAAVQAYDAVFSRTSDSLHGRGADPQIC